MSLRSATLVNLDPGLRPQDHKLSDYALVPVFGLSERLSHKVKRPIADDLE